MTEGVFLYFIPGKDRRSVTRADLESNPLLAAPFFDLIHSPRLFREKIIGPDSCSGPEGQSGCIVAAQPQVLTDQVPGYFPERQTWQKFGDQWIGYENDMKPGPESLRRPTILPGYDVELGDENNWVAPTIRPFHEDQQDWGSALPMKIGINQNIKHSARVAERYRACWQMTGRVADFLFNDQGVSQFALFDDAVTCLSINYRISSAEATILDLLDSDLINEIAKAAVDYQIVQRFLETSAGKNFH